ncbi:hypothetical protein U1Q18_010491 [Sarracenia purpurea var. burkii]
MASSTKDDLVRCNGSKVAKVNEEPNVEISIAHLNFDRQDSMRRDRLPTTPPEFSNQNPMKSPPAKDTIGKQIGHFATEGSSKEREEFMEDFIEILNPSANQDGKSGSNQPQLALERQNEANVIDVNEGKISSLKSREDF